jgi:hypothetical protein
VGFGSDGRRPNTLVRSHAWVLTHLYEHPACQAPHTPFSFLSSCPPFLLFDRAAGFLSPRPRIVAGRRAQGVSRLAAFQRPPSGLGLYTTEHDGRLDGSGRLHSYLIFSSSTRRRGCYCIPITDVVFLAGLATRSMARAIVASTYIRQLRSGLPRCCLHGRSRRWMGLIFGTAYWQVPICDVGQQPRIRPARHTRLGCRNSARYRVRAAPCGTRPCSR